MEVVVADAVVVVVAAADVAAVVVEVAAAATRVLHSPCDPCRRCKKSPTRYSILGGRGTRRTRTNAQFWTDTRIYGKK